MINTLINVPYCVTNRRHGLDWKKSTVNVERNHKKLSKRRWKKAANFEPNQFNEGRI